MSSVGRCLENWTSQKEEGNCSAFTIHSPRKRFLNRVDGHKPSETVLLMVIFNSSLWNLVLGNAFAHFH